MRWEEHRADHGAHRRESADDSGIRFEQDNRSRRLLWAQTRHYGPGMQVRGEAKCGREREQVIVSGWACDQRILCDGRRQIFAFLVPGDLIAVTGDESASSYDVVALTQLVVVSQAPGFMSDGDEPAVALRTEALVAAKRQEQLYDQLVRIGRLSARERAVHLLLELRHRLDRVGLVKADTFKLPVTQEVLADALGLSVVHVNRTLRELRDEGLLRIKAGAVTLKNLPRLVAISGYVAPN